MIEPQVTQLVNEIKTRLDAIVLLAHQADQPVIITPPVPVTKPIFNVVVTNPTPGVLKVTWDGGGLAQIYTQGSVTSPLVDETQNRAVPTGVSLTLDRATHGDWFGVIIKGVDGGEFKWDATPNTFKYPISKTIITITIPGNLGTIQGTKTNTIFQLIGGNYSAKSVEVNDGNEFVPMIPLAQYIRPNIVVNCGGGPGLVLRKNNNRLAGLIFTNAAGTAILDYAATNTVIEDCWYESYGTNSSGTICGYMIWAEGTNNLTLNRCVAPKLQGTQDLFRLGSNGTAVNTATNITKNTQILNCVCLGTHANPDGRIMCGDGVLVQGCVFRNPGDNVLSIQDIISYNKNLDIRAKNITIKNNTFSGNICIYPGSNYVTVTENKFDIGSVIQPVPTQYTNDGVPLQSNIIIGSNGVGAVNTFNIAKLAGLQV